MFGGQQKMQLKGNSGFSLVELMIVVTIIGILAAIAVPRFQTFQARAKQAEAKSNLSHIYTLEVAAYTENEIYVSMGITPVGTVCAANALGFRPTPCDNRVRYQYQVINATGAAFQGTAQSRPNMFMNNCPAIGADTWTVDQTKAIGQLPTQNGFTNCTL